jgi:hypothetical protein
VFGFQEEVPREQWEKRNSGAGNGFSSSLSTINFQPLPPSSLSTINLFCRRGVEILPISVYQQCLIIKKSWTNPLEYDKWRACVQTNARQNQLRGKPARASILPARVAWISVWLLAGLRVSAVQVNDPSTLWQAFPGNYDFAGDQQAGSPAGDIVGTTSNPGFFTTFNSNGLASNTDGTLGFRIRLDAAGGPANKPAFDRVAWVGIDADLNGSIDMFMGANFQGSRSELSIRDVGSGLNNSPNSTSVSSTAAYTYTPGALNYDYRMVNYMLDGGTTNDITTNTTGDPDYYLSFFMPLQDIVNFLITKGIYITDNSPLRYVLATSTQANNLNQDIGGIMGSTNSTSTWGQLGAFTPTITGSGTVIPEPGSALILASGVLLLMRRRRVRVES